MAFCRLASDRLVFERFEPSRPDVLRSDPERSAVLRFVWVRLVKTNLDLTNLEPKKFAPKQRVSDKSALLSLAAEIFELMRLAPTRSASIRFALTKVELRNMTLLI
jgi:hypothetical protein